MPLGELFDSYVDRAIQTVFKSLLLIFCPRVSNCIPQIKTLNNKYALQLKNPWILDHNILLDISCN